jgi:hypothetical protein
MSAAWKRNPYVWLRHFAPANTVRHDRVVIPRPIFTNCCLGRLSVSMLPDPDSAAWLQFRDVVRRGLSAENKDSRLETRPISTRSAGCTFQPRGVDRSFVHPVQLCSTPRKMPGKRD